VIFRDRSALSTCSTEYGRAARTATVPPRGCGPTGSGWTGTAPAASFVPLSRWADGNDIDTFSIGFLHDEFNLSRRTQQLLLAQAWIVPIFEGLDEIPDLPRRAAILVDFVQQLRMWRPVPDGIRYVVSIREDAWRSVDQTVRARLNAERFTITDIDPDTATAFLADSVPLTRPADVAQNLMLALQQQLYQQVNWASRLSMLGVLLAEDVDADRNHNATVERIVAAVREHRLPAIYLATLLSHGGPAARDCGTRWQSPHYRTTPAICGPTPHLKGESSHTAC
jgi:hypothetical protein